MADPLGLIGGVGGAGGMGGIRPFQRPADGATPDGGAPGASFKDVLLKNIEEVNKLQAEASQATEDLVTGKRADLEGVVLATQKADTAFRMLLAVKNKVQQAFEEVKQMRV